MTNAFTTITVVLHKVMQLPLQPTDEQWEIAQRECNGSPIQYDSWVIGYQVAREEARKAAYAYLNALSAQDGTTMNASQHDPQTVDTHSASAVEAVASGAADQAGTQAAIKAGTARPERTPLVLSGEGQGGGQSLKVSQFRSISAYNGRRHSISVRKSPVDCNVMHVFACLLKPVISGCILTFTILQKA